ncbi:hypothetical protein DMA11_21745 [Marinilabiliaceae bacterium JC017]|nr:hypothetical protein DMA11_21745 [Marinilabiliaceae bacterium JC017]
MVKIESKKVILGLNIGLINSEMCMFVIEIRDGCFQNDGSILMRPVFLKKVILKLSLACGVFLVHG